MGTAARGYHAELDAIEIWVHVARRDPAAADRLIDRLTASIELLATQPHLGRAADHLFPKLRAFPIGAHVIFYRPFDDGIWGRSDYSRRAPHHPRFVRVR